jgi:glutamine synthetase
VQNLEQGSTIIAEYVWIDGSGIALRAKAKSITTEVEMLEDLPEWNYDGSSTYQASTHNSEVILKPVAMYRDPFREMNNIIVLCDSYIWDDDKFTKLVPANTNFRFYAE